MGIMTMYDIPERQYRRPGDKSDNFSICSDECALTIPPKRTRIAKQSREGYHALLAV
ncbi:MAG TPA: hypothetical protein VMS89_04295 [Methanoregulaceae archaeon]|nr:hypothetical protein [Methanoregulaceae archaeon]